MMRTAAAVLIGIAVGVAVTLAFTWGERTRSEGPRSGRDADSAARRRRAEETARIEERLRRSQQKENELRATIEELNRELRAHRDAARPSDAAPGADGRRTLKGPRFVFAESEETLRSIDWDAAGAATAQLMPVLSEAIDVAHGRKENRHDLWNDIMRHVGPLVTADLKLESAGLAWSNPSFLVNLVHATLLKAGHPLSEAQEEELHRLGLRYVEEDERRRAGYGDTTLALRKLIDSCKLQDRFFEEVRGLLNGAQKNVLYPPGVEGIVGTDVFSGATVWEEQFDRIEHGGRASLGAAAAARHAADLELGSDAEAVLRTLVAEWAAALPDPFVDHAPSEAHRQAPYLESSARVLFAAERQAALFEALLQRASLDDAERERVIEQDEVLVPLRK